MSAMRLLILFSAVIFFNCNKKKDEWKLPTDVSFKMDINRSSSQNGQLVFSGGTALLTGFAFDGSRTQGDDVYFSKSYSGLTVPFGSTVADLQFDIPQGTYTKITISLQTASSPFSNIVVNGTYKNVVSGKNYALRFECKSAQFFNNLVAKNRQGGNEIILQKDKSVTATVKLDPVYWFQPAVGILNSAAIVADSIPISESFNENIYNIVIGRVDDAAEVIFE